MRKLNTSAIIFSLLFLVGCKQHTEEFAVKTESVQTGVRNMAADIAKGLLVKGPVTWLDYFERNPNFFMANEGQRMFANYDSAEQFINETLVKEIMKINLTWGNMYVDSLSPTLAIMSADFNEVLIDKNNQSIQGKGYFTGTAEKTDHGWKLRNLHWSSLPKKQ